MALESKLNEKDAVPLSVCPSSGIEYVGSCPVVKCPANVSHIEGRGAGCVYLLLKGEITKHQLSWCFKEDVSIVSAKIDKGNLRIRASMFMERISHMLKYTGHVCSKCKVPRQTKGDCPNVKRCDRRQALSKRLLKKFPFNHSAFKIGPTQLFMLGLKHDQLSKLLMDHCITTSTSMYDLLQIPKKRFLKLTTLTESLK